MNVRHPLRRREPNGDLSRRWLTWSECAPLVLVAAAVLFGLWTLRAELTQVADPNDGAFHLATITTAGHLLSHGISPLDHWFPNLGLGSPYFVQYQSASAILTGAAGLVIGYGHAFTWSLYLLLALWPICVYASARLLGLSRWQAAIAAAVAPLLLSVTGYGFENQSYLWVGNGLWSQEWAMWTLPLGWGFGWRFISQRRFLLGAVAMLSLTIAFHFLTAYLAGLILIVLVLVKPREIWRRTLRAFVIGVGALLATLWVTVPLLADSKWISANELETGTFWTNSYGARQVLDWLVSGQIYDHGRFPIVTILVAIGVVCCLVRFRTHETHRVILGVWVLSLLLFFGRPTLGVVLDVLPGNSQILFPRYIIGVQLAGLFLAGVGVTWVLELVVFTLDRARPAWRNGLADHAWLRPAALVVAAVAVILILTPAWSEIATYNAGNATWIASQQSADATEGSDVTTLAQIAESLGGGRIYAGFLDGWGEYFDVGDVPVSIYLNGLNVDTVGTLRSSSLMSNPELIFDESNPGDYTTFGVRFLMLPVGHTPPVPAHLVQQLGGYQLWSVGAPDFISVVDTQGVIAANANDLGTVTQSFLDSQLPDENIYPTIAYDGQAAAPATLAPGEHPTGPAGKVLSENVDLAAGTASATVYANRTAVVLLSSSFDPGWSVTVDGETVAPEIIAPALVGVAVAPGEHHIVFTFHGYGSYLVLYVVAVLTLVGAGVGDTVLRRRARSMTTPASDTTH